MGSSNTISCSCTQDNTISSSRVDTNRSPEMLSLSKTVKSKHKPDLKEEQAQPLSDNKFEIMLKNSKNKQLSEQEFICRIDPIILETIERLGNFPFPKQDPKYIARPPVEFKESGNIYKGQLNDQFEMHGNGLLIMESGLYEGTFKSNQISGKGRFINKYGDYYCGDWLDGKVYGFGLYEYRGLVRYEGEWKADVQHGDGEERDNEGTIYRGGFFNGVKQGNAIIKWANGASYNGNVENERLSGHGVYVWPDGRSYSGIWEKDNMNGFGVFKWPDGQSYSGMYKNDKKHGKGLYKDGRDIEIEGYWVKNVLDGKVAFKFRGFSYKVIFRKGKVIKDSSGFSNILEKEAIDELAKIQISEESI